MLADGFLGIKDIIYISTVLVSRGIIILACFNHQGKVINFVKIH